MVDLGLVEDLLEDVGDLLFGEDATVGSSGQEPEPGDHFHLIASLARLASARRKTADVSVKRPRLVLGILEAEGDRFSDKVLGLDIVPFGEQFQGETEESRHLLVAGEGNEAKCRFLAGVQRRFDVEVVSHGGGLPMEIGHPLRSGVLGLPLWAAPLKTGATAGLPSSVCPNLPEKHCWASRQWHPNWQPPTS